MFCFVHFLSIANSLHLKKTLENSLSGVFYKEQTNLLFWVNYKTMRSPSQSLPDNVAQLLQRFDNPWYKPVHNALDLCSRAQFDSPTDCWV
jgi:hypothetical protein